MGLGMIGTYNNNYVAMSALVNIEETYQVVHGKLSSESVSSFLSNPGPSTQPED